MQHYKKTSDVAAKSGPVTTPPELKEVFATFISKYKPVKTRNQADTFLTTDQVYEQLFAICPAEFTKKDVYDLMKKSGFGFDTIAGDERTFYWLLKIVN